jgi:lipid-binding SYLF domain-containing protein
MARDLHNKLCNHRRVADSPEGAFTMSTRPRLLALVLTLQSLATFPVLADLGATPAANPEAADAAQFVSASRSSLARFLVDPEMAWFREHLGEARALLIVPRRVRAGLLFGGSGGVGILVAKDPATGEWGQPVFYNLGGASVGFQIGGDRSELILLVRSEEALDAFLSKRFQLGAEASVAAGPVGAGTGEQVDEEIVAFVRSKGLYAGAAIEGTMIRPADERNRAFYGRDVSPVDILVRQNVASEEALGLREDLARAATVSVQ